MSEDTFAFVVEENQVLLMGPACRTNLAVVKSVRWQGTGTRGQL
jgi:hypothetical protein